MAQQMLRNQEQSNGNDVNRRALTQTLAILGEAQLRQGKFDEANRTFEEALQSASAERQVLDEQDGTGAVCKSRAKERQS